MGMEIAMITILVLSGSSLQEVIVHQVENQYAKACMNYGLKCVLSENIKIGQKGQYLDSVYGATREDI